MIELSTHCSRHGCFARSPFALQAVTGVSCFAFGHLHTSNTPSSISITSLSTLRPSGTSLHCAQMTLCELAFTLWQDNTLDLLRIDFHWTLCYWSGSENTRLNQCSFQGSSAWLRNPSSTSSLTNSRREQAFERPQGACLCSPRRDFLQHSRTLPILHLHQSSKSKLNSHCSRLH